MMVGVFFLLVFLFVILLLVLLLILFLILFLVVRMPFVFIGMTMILIVVSMPIMVIVFIDYIVRGVHDVVFFILVVGFVGGVGKSTS